MSAATNFKLRFCPFWSNVIIKGAGESRCDCEAAKTPHGPVQSKDDDTSAVTGVEKPLDPKAVGFLTLLMRDQNRRKMQDT